MTTAEAIIQRLQSLPETEQAEVLDFVSFLEAKAATSSGRARDLSWSQLSLTAAMRGMEDEPSPYTIADVKERFE